MLPSYIRVRAVQRSQNKGTLSEIIHQSNNVILLAVCGLCANVVSERLTRHEIELNFYIV